MASDTLSEFECYDGSAVTKSYNLLSQYGLINAASAQEREELAFAVIASLPRPNIASLQCRIEPLLRLDVLGLLPDEVALQVLSYLPCEALLTCSLVSRRWRALADDQSLWRHLCLARGWRWRTPLGGQRQTNEREFVAERVLGDDDDEGMGDDEGSGNFESQELLDYLGQPSTVPSCLQLPSAAPATVGRDMSLSAELSRCNGSVPHFQAVSSEFLLDAIPDYKLLHRTHLKLQHRVLSGSYNLSDLQHGSPNKHSSTIYCLQLYTYPESGEQVLFTGSKDRSIREWHLASGKVTRVLERVHESSVLSLCVRDDLLASGGSDCRVVIWDLRNDSELKVIEDHLDSVLCVRFDETRLISCSKDQTVRTYLLPDFRPEHVFYDHRAAVNSVAISSAHIISASGDRSLRLRDAKTGALLRTYEDHHDRGIATIDFRPPFVLSGSSDRHLCLIDITTSNGWSTSASACAAHRGLARAGGTEASSVDGRTISNGESRRGRTRLRAHEDLVRSVALSDDIVVSGSYDHTVKVWDRKTGALIVDLAGGHTGRIFCVACDAAKIVSCGEDQKICIWDFSHGIDISFIEF
ncbi:WD40 repeat-like protein [Laetiporus sulphureus 93-53]|uniref:WD40 repeat-like protein n=1 Tax=Laetiporus sulphureus 93-53 TaxID=1314785 RepID=A0A165C7R8_9APHY|nr:WD40 repeat-like protein [Laetiporus sulphureus 93-53]KZT02346.1 WD40 repeat-like protein [Laetiporus sulphureus 93-53]